MNLITQAQLYYKDAVHYRKVTKRSEYQNFFGDIQLDVSLICYDGLERVTRSSYKMPRELDENIAYKFVKAGLRNIQGTSGSRVRCWRQGRIIHVTVTNNA